MLSLVARKSHSYSAGRLTGFSTLVTNPETLSKRGRLRLAGTLPARSVLLLAIVAVVLVYGVIYPNARVFLSAFQHDGAWSLTNFLGVLSQRVVIESAFTSIAVSVLTVALCALVGVPLAFL